MIGLYGRSEQEWRESKSGLTVFEGTFQLAVPELAGTIAPTIVGSKERVRDADSGITSIFTHPIDSRVDIAVRRALKYAELRRKSNAQKRVALMFYNFHPRQGERRRELSQCRGVDRQHPATAEARGLRSGRSGSVERQCVARHHDAGSECHGSGAGRAGADAAKRQCDPHRRE